MSTGVMIIEVHTFTEEQLDGVYRLVALHRDVIHVKRLDEA